MKNKILYMAAVSMAMLTLASCQKDARTEDVVVPQEKGTIVNPVVIRATLDTDDTKSTVSSAGNFAWTATTDLVAYHTTEGYVVSSGASETGVSTEFTVDGNKTRDAFAIFPSTIVAANAANYGQSGTALDVTLPGTYTLDQVLETNTPCPMIATSAADAWSFSQLCGLIRMTVNSIPPSATKLTVDFHGKKVQGAFSIASPVTPGTSSIITSDTDDDDDIITITFAADGTSWRDGVDINLPIPTGNYTKVTVEAYNDSDARPLLSVTRKVKIGEDSYSLARAAGKKVTASLPAFSISDTKRVAIAKSNLKATTTDGWTTYTWSFMDNPWDIVENANVNDNYSGATVVSLFGWGASGISGMDGYGSSYYPNATSTDYSTYGAGANSLTGSYANGDWGIAHNSELGSYSPSWRLLTGDECLYLFGMSENRTNDSGNTKRYLKWGYATVNGVTGILLVPDNFNDPKTNQGSAACVFGRVGGTQGLIVYQQNIYTATQWEAMSELGAIFHPAAGYRPGTTYTNRNTDYYVGGEGGWWCSTTSNANQAHRLYFNSSEVCPKFLYNTRHIGRNIRLIREIQ